MDRDARIYVAGHTGLAGSAVVRALEAAGYARVITVPRAEADLTDPAAVEELFRSHRPEYVFLCAARVGGIAANSRQPGDFIRDNLLIQTHIIDACRRFGVKRLLFLGSSCIYPREAPQPIREEHLLAGPLEPTNQAYAAAKIAGVMMCRAYRRQFGLASVCLMPSNLYGPGDRFDPENGHVLAALMVKFHRAACRGDRTVTVWGTGTPRREFLYADDLAQACLKVMEAPREAVDAAACDGLLNVGWGEDYSIRDLAEAMARVTGFGGDLVWDASRPDGTPRKLLDCSRIHSLGWAPQVRLAEGLERTYAWFRERWEEASPFPGEGAESRVNH